MSEEYKAAQARAFHAAISAGEEAVKLKPSHGGQDLTLESLKMKAGVTDEQLDMKISESDLPSLASCFDTTVGYVEALGLSPGEQTDVELKQQVHGTKGGMLVALKCWKRKTSGASFRALVIIALDMRGGEVAVGLCQYIKKKCSSGGVVEPALPAAVQSLREYLMRLYLQSKLPIKGKFPPSSCKKIINLATVEKQEMDKTSLIGLLDRSETIEDYMSRNKMTPIEMNDLLLDKDGSPAQVVVVQGVPGIGKSTFAWKMCRKWGKGKAYKDYDLVVLLQMRDRRMREATQLSDLLYHPKAGLSSEVADYLIANGGKGALFILEGVDELPSSCLADCSPLSDLLQGVSLPEAAIVSTTRPWAVASIVDKCSERITRKVEILGFTKQDILRYLSQAFNEEEMREFLEYIHSHPQLESIMHIPLNAAFLVHIYKHLNQSQRDIPKTLTQLYTALVEGLLVRYSKDSPDIKELRNASLENLPDSVESRFQNLCRLAFSSFSKEPVQVSFTESEAALFECYDYLGLMCSSSEMTINTSTTVTHSFLHFTLQEFLAARHLSKQPDQDQQLFIRDHYNNPQFAMLIRFLLGLNNRALKFLKPLSSERLSTRELHWLFETQSPQGVCDYLGSGRVEYQSLESNTSLDLYALSYCLCHSNCEWDLIINISALSTLYTPQGPTTDVYCGKVRILQLINCTSHGLNLFFSLPRRLFIESRQLIVLTYPQEDCFKRISKILRSDLMPKLHQFLVSDTDKVGILTALKSHPTPITVSFNKSHLTRSDVIVISDMISSPDGPANLIGLGFWMATFEDDSLQLLLSIPGRGSVTLIDLSGNKLSLQQLKQISESFCSNPHLKQLNLQNCSIDDEGASRLANGLKGNKTLSGLNLYINNIGHDGAVALASMLTLNSSLEYLSLTVNPGIGTMGALALIKALERNTTITKLKLPAECEPPEYHSPQMREIRDRQIVKFI